MSCLVTAAFDRYFVLPDLIATTSKARIRIAEEILDDAKEVEKAKNDPAIKRLDRTLGKETIDRYPYVAVESSPDGSKE